MQAGERFICLLQSWNQEEQYDDTKTDKPGKFEPA